MKLLFFSISILMFSTCTFAGDYDVEIPPEAGNLGAAVNPYNFESDKLLSSGRVGESHLSQSGETDHLDKSDKGVTPATNQNDEKAPTDTSTAQ